MMCQVFKEKGAITHRLSLAQIRLTRERSITEWHTNYLRLHCSNQQEKVKEDIKKVKGLLLANNYQSQQDLLFAMSKILKNFAPLTKSQKQSDDCTLSNSAKSKGIELAAEEGKVKEEIELLKVLLAVEDCQSRESVARVTDSLTKLAKFLHLQRPTKECSPSGSNAGSIYSQKVATKEVKQRVLCSVCLRWRLPVPNLKNKTGPKSAGKTGELGCSPLKQPNSHGIRNTIGSSGFNSFAETDDKQNDICLNCFLRTMLPPGIQSRMREDGTLKPKRDESPPLQARRNSPNLRSKPEVEKVKGCGDEAIKARPLNRAETPKIYVPRDPGPSGIKCYLIHRDGCESVVEMFTYAEHLRSQHHVPTVRPALFRSIFGKYSYTAYFGVPIGMLKKKDSTAGPNQVISSRLLECDGLVFVGVIQVKSNAVYFGVFHIGRETDAGKYVAKITVPSITGKKASKYEGTAAIPSLLKKKENRPPNVLRIHGDTLKTLGIFNDKTSQYECKVKYKIIKQ